MNRSVKTPQPLVAAQKSPERIMPLSLLEMTGEQLELYLKFVEENDALFYTYDVITDRAQKLIELYSKN